MSKLTSLDGADKVLFESVAKELELNGFCDLEAFWSSGKSKQVIKVSKASAPAEFMSKTSNLFYVVINEKSFSPLDEDAKRMLLIDALNDITYDVEKDVVKLGGERLNMSLSAYRRFGSELISLHESLLMSKDDNEGGVL